MDREAVKLALSSSFPSNLRVRAKKALFAYALDHLDEGALKRAAGLTTREALIDEIRPFLSTPLKKAALKALIQKGPYKEPLKAPVALALLKIMGQANSQDPESITLGALAIAAGTALNMKELPGKIPGSLKLARNLVTAQLSSMVKYWQPYDDKALYRQVLAVLQSRS